MADFSPIGKWLVIVGLTLAGAGAFIWASSRIPFLGRLPGDIKIESEHFKFYFPLASCLLLSVFVSFLLWLFSKFK
jgi:hypothetical protein